MRYLSIFAILFLLNSCQSANPEIEQQLAVLQAKLEATKAELAAAQTDPTGFVHAVYFWYKEDLSEDRKATFENSLDELTKVESIEAVYYGRPSVSQREVVDDSYDLAWVCTFADSAAQEAYQVDPIHKKFVQEYNDVWSKVKIYDSYARMDK